MKIIESLAPIEKMLLFEKGLRKENVKACSNEKLEMYLDICKDNNLSIAGRAIELELLNRHLLQNTEAEFITFTVDGLTKYEENIIDALYKFFVTKTSIVSEADLLKQLTEVDNGRSIQDFMRSLGRITGIAAILISKLKNANYTKQLVAILTEPKLLQNGPYVSKDQLSRILKNLISNQKVLNSLSTIISSYQVDQNELKEAIEKHDTLNPKL